MTSESIIIGIVPKNINIEAENNWKKGYCTNLENFYKHNLGVASILHLIKQMKEIFLK